MAKISAYLLIAAGLGWIVHSFLEGEESQNQTTTSGNKASKINFNKYLTKKPKFEKDYIPAAVISMQELGSYNPPT